jgi:hypothetical protein
VGRLLSALAEEDGRAAGRNAGRCLEARQVAARAPWSLVKRGTLAGPASGHTMVFRIVDGVDRCKTVKHDTRHYVYTTYKIKIQ